MNPGVGENGQPSRDTLATDWGYRGVGETKAGMPDEQGIDIRREIHTTEVGISV
jgi:hypothetical protein